MIQISWWNVGNRFKLFKLSECSRIIVTKCSWDEFNLLKHKFANLSLW